MGGVVRERDGEEGGEGSMIELMIGGDPIDRLNHDRSFRIFVAKLRSIQHPDLVVIRTVDREGDPKMTVFRHPVTLRESTIDRLYLGILRLFLEDRIQPITPYTVVPF